MTDVPAAPVAARDVKGWMVFIFLAFVWGGSFILIKKGLIHFSPLEVGSLRVFISAVAFVPIYFLSKVAFPKGKAWKIILTVFLGNGIPAFLFALAETRLGSAVTGVLNSLSPIFALIIAIFLFNEKFRKHYLVGLLLGCAGIGLLMAGEKDWQVSVYVFYIVLATFCYGLSANMVKKYGQDIHPLAFTSIGFMAIGILAGGILIASGTFSQMDRRDVLMESLLPLVALALICTVIANIMFYWLIQRTSAIFGSAIAYAIPCMALVWGSLDGELITWYQLGGFALIISAIYTLRKR
jgi:drug/metabolite transporter (DMT)-like permease